MGDFNMPPGISVNDIPGNRPEDIAEEEFWEKLSEHADTDKLPEGWEDDEAVIAIIRAARDLGYTAGYGDGKADAQMEISARELDRQDSEQ